MNLVFTETKRPELTIFSFARDHLKSHSETFTKKRECITYIKLTQSEVTKTKPGIRSSLKYFYI